VPAFARTTAGVSDWCAAQRISLAAICVGEAVVVAEVRVAGLGCCAGSALVRAETAHSRRPSACFVRGSEGALFAAVKAQCAESRRHGGFSSRFWRESAGGSP